MTMADMIRKKIPFGEATVQSGFTNELTGETKWDEPRKVRTIPISQEEFNAYDGDKAPVVRKIQAPIPAAPERPVSTVKTADDAYPVYKRGGDMSKSFNTAFGEARARGDKTFEWQ